MATIRDPLKILKFKKKECKKVCRDKIREPLVYQKYTEKNYSRLA